MMPLCIFVVRSNVVRFQMVSLVMSKQEAVQVLFCFVRSLIF